MYFHICLGDGSRLIDTEHVAASQRLDTFHIMHENLLRSQTHNADGKGNARKQVKTFWDHAEHGGHHRGNALTERFVGDEKLLAEEQKTDRNDQNADNLYQLVEGADHLGLFALFHGLCLEGQTGNVGIFTDLGQTALAASRDDKTSGHQLVARALGNLIGFTGKQRFVDLYLTFKHDGISADLFSCGKYNNIIEYEILRGECYLSTVTDRSSLRRV